MGPRSTLLNAVQADADAAGELDWLIHAVDSTVVRAHQHAAGLRPGKTPPRRTRRPQLRQPSPDE